MMKVLCIALLLPNLALASDERKEVYLQYEKAYMSNDVSEFVPWLDEDFSISQTLHIPGVGADTRPLSTQQLLASMKASGKPNSLPQSSRQDTEIENISGGGFCGKSATVRNTVVNGEEFEEKEARKVCFRKSQGEYKAVSHKIDVHYRAL